MKQYASIILYHLIESKIYMILIKNVNINTVTNVEIKGDILIKNKKIEKIAESIDTTCLEDVEVIDADGLNVFPGFIDAHTHLGLWEDGLGFEGADGNEETDPITPNLNPIDAINPMDHTFKEAYEGGIKPNRCYKSNGPYI